MPGQPVVPALRGFAGAIAWLATAGTMSCASPLQWHGDPDGDLPAADASSSTDGATITPDGAPPLPTQRLLNGYVSGTTVWLQTCDLTVGGDFDCSPADHPWSQEPLTPSLMMFNGITVTSRYALVYLDQGVQKLRNGVFAEGTQQLWSQECELDTEGHFDCDPSTHPFVEWSLPTTLVGHTLAHRYLFSFSVSGQQKMRQGFVAADGTRSWSQVCDLVDGAEGIQFNCDEQTHPFTEWPLPPVGLEGEEIESRFAYAFEYGGDTVVTIGFIATDGLRSWESDCQVISQGDLDCGAEPFTLRSVPPEGVQADVVTTRFGAVYTAP